MTKSIIRDDKLWPKPRKRSRQDWEKAQRAVLAEAARPGLAQAVAEGTKEHLARRTKRGDYAGKEIRVEADEAAKHEQHKGSRKRHVAQKIAQNGADIQELAAVIGDSAAKNAIDSKRGSRALRNAPAIR